MQRSQSGRKSLLSIPLLRAAGRRNPATRRIIALRDGELYEEHLPGGLGEVREADQDLPEIDHQASDDVEQAAQRPRSRIVGARGWRRLDEYPVAHRALALRKCRRATDSARPGNGLQHAKKVERCPPGSLSIVQIQKNAGSRRVLASQVSPAVESHQAGCAPEIPKLRFSSRGPG